jgi:preprotein translocase subunit SecD
MLHFNKWKIGAIAAICLLGFLYALPNMLPEGAFKGMPSWWPKKTLSLGLDLRGGSYLLLEADVNELKAEWLETIEQEARKTLREGKIGYSGLGRAGEAVRLRLTKPEQQEAALTALRTMIRPLEGNIFTGAGSPDLEIKTDADSAFTIAWTEPALKARVTKAISSAIETVRRRVDQLGTTEPLIQRQGADRIVVQVPGFDNPEQLKDVIKKTAKLTFHEVDLTKSPSDAAATGVPVGSELFPMDEKEGGGQMVLVKAPVVSGEDLVDAQPSFDGQTNEPVVSFRFNTSGARKFGKYTQENVGRPFAIVLDGHVISAPRILGAILGGSGQISGNFTIEEANSLSILLRSGALPVSLEIVEERSVGPSLGQDSIESGKVAAIIGGIATALLTMLVYGLFGLFAVVALAINGLLIVGVMSAMQSTLTLPGIAGIVLTIGMAVDANVLIYERIKEELRAGKNAISAIEAGFSRAFITIADSQLTTLAAALVMFWLGSGPVRGFAVTLSIGVITSMFTAVTVTRLIVSLWLKRARTRQRQIAVPI